MMSSTRLVNPEHAAGIAALAGQTDPEMFWISASDLYVVGVEPAALEQAAATYDHTAYEGGAIERALTRVLNTHLDSTANQRNYDSRFTCALRAGYPGPFQAEGQVFAAWMDECNMVAYQLMAEVKKGLRSIPTEAELIAAMPVIEWPPSPVPEGAA